MIQTQPFLSPSLLLRHTQEQLSLQMPLYLKGCPLPNVLDASKLEKHEADNKQCSSILFAMLSCISINQLFQVLSGSWTVELQGI